MVAGKRLGVVKNTASGSRCGPCCVSSKNSPASGEWQWGDRKASGGTRAQCSMPLRCGRGGTVAVEQATVMRARRVGSIMDG